MPVPPIAARRSAKGDGIVTLLTDFGTRDAFVGIMKGVILGVNPRARLVDLTHDIEPQDLRAGALVLRSAVRYFPRRTVHLAVVDPGVGSARRAIAIATPHAFLVGPDNGVLAPAALALGIKRAHTIDVERLTAVKILRQPVSATFHGRDVFAPVAAHLSAGLPVQSLGPATGGIEELALPACRTSAGKIAGEVIHVDRFGNLVTNIAAGDLRQLNGFSPAHLSVSIAAMRIRGLVPAYAAVAEGGVLAIIDSWGQLEIAVRGGSAAQRLAADRGSPVQVAVI